MFAAWFFSCSLLIWEVPWTVSQPSQCCLKKVVDGVVYTFLRKNPVALEMNCKNDCIYSSTDRSPHATYCFEAGSMESVCLSEPHQTDTLATNTPLALAPTASLSTTAASTTTTQITETTFISNLPSTTLTTGATSSTTNAPDISLPPIPYTTMSTTAMSTPTYTTVSTIHASSTTTVSTTAASTATTAYTSAASLTTTVSTKAASTATTVSSTAVSRVTTAASARNTAPTATTTTTTTETSDTISLTEIPTRTEATVTTMTPKTNFATSTTKALITTTTTTTTATTTTAATTTTTTTLTPTPTTATTTTTTTHTTGVLLTGGDYPNYQSTELFPPVSGCTTPQLPASRQYHSTFMTDDLVLATCGGVASDGRLLSDCFILDPVSVQWKTDTSVLGHLPGKRGYAADVTMAGVGSYLLGGYDGSLLSSSAFLPTGSSTWQSGPSLPQALYGACAFSYKTSFIVTGGYSSGYLSDVREYSTETGQWLDASTWPSLLTARGYHGCAVVGSTAVIAGGNGRASTELFNLESKTKISGGTLQSARAVHLVTLGTGSQLRILAFGNNLVEEWIEETDTWREAGRLQEKRFQRMEESSTWREAGRLQESRYSPYMGAVAVPEGLVCKKEN